MKSERCAINLSSFASDLARLRLSAARLRKLCPSLYRPIGVGGFIRCVVRDGLSTRKFISGYLPTAIAALPWY